MDAHSKQCCDSRRSSDSPDRSRSSFIERIFAQSAAGISASVFVILVSTIASTRTASGQCYYTYQEIPHPPGNPPQFTAGRALNNLGNVAGRYNAGGDTSRAFFWSPETGTYLLPFPPGIVDMEATGINDLDQVCGWMTSHTQWYGFVWDRQSGEYTTMEMPAWATQIYPAAINNAGVVVGTLGSSHGVRAFRWQNGAFYNLAADLDVVSSQAYDVNETGESAGGGGANGNDYMAFLAYSADVVWLPRPLTFSSCEAWGLCNTGFVAGPAVCAPAATCVHSLVWSPGSVHDVSPPSGFGRVLLYDVNDAGRAAGFADRGASGVPSRALVWQNDQTVDLNTLSVDSPRELTTAWAINEAGQIIATRGVLTPVWLPGDLTGDCHVSVEDLVLVLANFGMPRGSFPRGDVNLDGEVGLADLSILLAHWCE